MKLHYKLLKYKREHQKPLNCFGFYMGETIDHSGQWYDKDRHPISTEDSLFFKNHGYKDALSSVLTLPVGYKGC